MTLTRNMVAYTSISSKAGESLNNNIQTFIHQNPQRGGYGRGEGKGKSCIFPL
jgi:hypothetical protein